MARAGVVFLAQWIGGQRRFGHLPYSRRPKVPGTTFGRGRALSPAAAGGAGSKSAIERYTLCVFESSAMVRARCTVLTCSTTEYLSGESSCAMLSVPSPQELNTYFVSGSKAVASTPDPMAGVATTCPVSAFITATILLWQPEKMRRLLVSIAMPEGSSQGASGQRCATVSFFASISNTSLLPSILTYT